MGRSIILMSGGLDSTAVLSNLSPPDVVGVTIDYNQKNIRELDSAKKIAKYYGIEHHIFKIDLAQIGGSSLTSDTEVENGIPDWLPNSYVPARNIIFLSIAGGYARKMGINRIIVGTNGNTKSTPPDSTPKFLFHMQEALEAGLDMRGLGILSPVQYMSKAEIIKYGLVNDAPFHLTYTCYRGGEKACGKCTACMKRLAGFSELGLSDVIEYES